VIKIAALLHSLDTSPCRWAARIASIVPAVWLLRFLSVLSAAPSPASIISPSHPDSNRRADKRHA
ncbi:MAG TPA: hypothetical protein VFE62_15175, partial [Gemmataceae bacterium]|nr:hypothetical protein [Gemmataceae bacterium]